MNTNTPISCRADVDDNELCIQVDGFNYLLRSVVVELNIIHIIGILCVYNMHCIGSVYMMELLFTQSQERFYIRGTIWHNINPAAHFNTIQAQPTTGSTDRQCRMIS